MNRQTLEKLIGEDDQGLLRDQFTDGRDKFRVLIASQDLLRNVMCQESGKAFTILRELDKQFSKAINAFGEIHHLGSVSNTNNEGA